MHRYWLRGLNELWVEVKAWAPRPVRPRRPGMTQAM
ncbi:hypothetical protein CryarDRAFT_3564 [Cryptosporangium arvum DSM 44712]|uniref:Uncharacterized protein n=1 Tax=Cryptosporangium arvum DSM 44712 TaxID=927661 RepID=A0A011AK88_9ACTN|nr:hypothetical protein CryarDRAFT_3564 [Cryptosporangium arvum DSM 44712]